MVRDLVDRHPKLKRGDTKAENPSVKQQSNGNSNIYHKVRIFLVNQEKFR